MKISQDIATRFGDSAGDGASQEEIEAGMLQKSKEFAESGNRVYLPLAD